MVNTRVLELLKNPKNIQSEDLHLLKEEINSFPYIQNIRALHLYGVHLFDKENYQKELSTTAAYTTDKKILYQLINGKILPTKTEPVEKEAQVIIENKTKNTKEPFWWVKEKKTFPKHDYKAISESLASPKAEIKHVVVNGERNRILFEGEENFLDEKHSEIIDLESTLESGVIVTQKTSFPIERVAEEGKTPNDTLSEEVSMEIIPQENIIGSEVIVEKNSDEAEVSSDETESFKAEGEILQEESVENEISTEDIESKNISEDLNQEITVNEDTIDSEKTEEKSIDESEVSSEVEESFKAEDEILEEESIENEISTENIDSEGVSEDLNPETIIDEDKISSEDVAEKINDESELSFHGTDSFLPDVKIETAVSEQKDLEEAPKSIINNHEDEMRRLIEEVEKKMKANKKDSETKTVEPEEEAGKEISFAETQDFVVEAVVENEAKANQAAEVISETKENFSEDKNETSVLEEIKEEDSVWKPMSFETHTPDSFSKKVELKAEQADKIEEIKEVSEDISLEEEKLETVTESISEETINEAEVINTTEEQAPVMNVSFFGADISSLAIKKEGQNQPEEKVEEQPSKPEIQTVLDSNVPGFINTWQSWLKIDRTDEVENTKVENKNKVIESFLENNPKISQLKDEVNFVVKEKTDDISHLMTETLATLYIEQKLYTKAIKAFQVLINKHPHRKEHFETKIQEIKDSRGKN